MKDTKIIKSSTTKGTHTMNTQHTPTPWKEKLWFVETEDGLRKVAICNFKGKTSDSLDECIANAAFIVRAVNAHEKLIGILQSILDASQKVIGGQDYGFVIHKNDMTYQKIKQAIAAAEKGE